MQGIFSKLFITAGAAATIFAGAIVPRPAAASTQDTIDTILGAAAVIGSVVLYDDYANEQANAVCGYTSDGGVVYCDGRVVMPDGQVFYPGQYDAGGWVYDGGWRRNERWRGPAPVAVYRQPARVEDRAPAYRAPRVPRAGRLGLP